MGKFGVFGLMGMAISTVGRGFTGNSVPFVIENDNNGNYAGPVRGQDP